MLKRVKIVACAVSCFATALVNAQNCVTIINLPDTIVACKNTTVQLNPTIITTGVLSVSDTTWTPAAGLSNPDIINPVATVTTTPAQYKLTIKALQANSVVNNGDFSSGNTGFNSNYTYQGTPAPPDLSEGKYGVTTNPNILHSGFASFGDHTTGTGNMMVCNGAPTPVTIWCQSFTVQPNTYYDFSAWGATTSGAGNPAQLQFQIDATLIGTPLQLPQITGQWVQFTNTWFSGASTNINICIYDAQTAAGGNDFAIDDITFRQYCTSSDSVYIKVIDIEPSITYTVGLGCSADTVHFTANNTGGTPSSYFWTFGDGTNSTAQNPVHAYSNPGTYTIKLVASDNGCGDSATTTVTIGHAMAIGIETDADSICAGDAIAFTGLDTATTPLTYAWDFGDGGTDNTQSPTHTYATPGVYTVTHTITDQVPCTKTVTHTVLVVDKPFTSMILSDTAICAGRPISVLGSVFRGCLSTSWDMGDGDIITSRLSVNHAYDSVGYHTITLTAKYDHCPDGIVSANVRVLPIPRVNIGSDSFLCPGSSALVLRNTAAVDTLPVTYKWSDGSKNTFLKAGAVGTYWLQVTNAEGCYAADTMDIRKSCYLDIPNAFTPGSDGLNDYFFPRELMSKKMTEFHMRIYNRWGEMLFETKKLDGRGWDGNFGDKPQPQGVYVYLIEATIGGEAQKFQGNVTLLR